MGNETTGGPPELGVHVRACQSLERVRMPSFFLKSVRPTGVAMMPDALPREACTSRVYRPTVEDIVVSDTCMGWFTVTDGG